MFQQLLEKKLFFFSYLDELPAFLAIVFYMLSNRCFKINKKSINMVIALGIFVFSGLLGNILYRYQPIKYVIIDLLTNLKFILAVYFSMKFFPNGVKSYKKLPCFLSIISILLFILFLADRLFGIYGGEIRHGIHASQLFFGHPNYLAGFCGFLIACLSIFGVKRHRFPIILDLIMLVFTLRAKALANAAVYLCLFYFIYVRYSKVKFYHYVLMGCLSVFFAWSQIAFYHITHLENSARSVMLMTSFIILYDYFPIGTGFGTYASHSAAANYSPVYYKYGFSDYYELRNSPVGTFFDDQFWPIILGQTGFIGFIAYASYLLILMGKINKLASINREAYFSSLFVFLYLMISTMADPGFNNTIAVPLALALGFAFNIPKYENNLEVNQLETFS